MSKKLVKFRAAHPFQGDNNASQLGFSAGDIISVDVNRQGSGGWVWGTIYGSARSGWCPQSYLILHHAPVATVAAPAPPPATQAPEPPSHPVQQPHYHQPSLPPVQQPYHHHQHHHHPSDWAAGPATRAPVEQVPDWASDPAPPQAHPPHHDGSHMYGDDDGDINDGFSGPIMGGSASDKQAFRASAPPVMHGSSAKDDDSPNNPFAQGLSNFGSKVRNVGRNSLTAVSTGAKKAGEFAKNTAAETKHRVQDMRSQQRAASHQNNKNTKPVKPGQQQQQYQQQQRTPQPQQQQQSTRSQQMQTNAMNGAARGAVVGGAVGLACNGVRGVKDGATRGGIIGGAHGAVRGWKPFG